MENSKQPAYPTVKITSDGDIGAIDGGLTKREYFASNILKGLVSNPEWAKSMNIPDDWDKFNERIVSGAIDLTDELLKQLEQ